MVFRNLWILSVYTLMGRSHLCFPRCILISLLIQFLHLVVQRFGGSKWGFWQVFVCLFSQEFQYTDPKESSGVYRSESNNCSIDFQKAWNPVGRTPLVCAHKGTSSFSLVYLLKITRLDSTKFQKLAKLRKE